MTVDMKELPGVREAIRAVAFSLQNLADSLGVSLELSELVSPPASAMDSAPALPAAADPAPVPPPPAAGLSASGLPKGVPALPVPPYEEKNVRPYLAYICKAGYGNQVKAAIESFGVTNLSKLPKEAYGELVEMVRPMYEEALKSVLQAGSSPAAAVGGDSRDK